jgi:putative glutamine amidotransferase
MSRPVIGLSCYLEHAAWGAWDITASVLPIWYLDLFQQAGATVVLLTPDTDPDPGVLDRVDGLVLVGGADVDSTLYGEAPDPTADAPRITRDRTEMAYYRGARDRGMPFLGICRGLQIMAVCHGGALHQNLPDVSELVHRERPGEFVDHAATFAPGSRIAAALGTTEMIVNSSHHQAVKDPGDLTITGWAADGTIEVCEDPGTSFVVGVQWHPEHPDRRIADAGLIEAFLDACTTRDMARTKR